MTLDQIQSIDSRLVYQGYTLRLRNRKKILARERVSASLLDIQSNLSSRLLYLVPTTNRHYKYLHPIQGIPWAQWDLKISANKTGRSTLRTARLPRADVFFFSLIWCIIGITGTFYITSWGHLIRCNARGVPIITVLRKIYTSAFFGAYTYTYIYLGLRRQKWNNPNHKSHYFH
jgi:hypothetical protein